MFDPRLLLLAPLLSGGLLGCASDSLPIPEPTIETPGAFVAVDLGTGQFSLSRTLSTFEAEQDTILIFTDYDVGPRSWEEAAEYARLPELPIATLVTAASGKVFLANNDHRVVWFRTLTAEERERVD